MNLRISKDDIVPLFRNLGSGIAESARLKIDEHSDRIVEGEDPQELLRETPMAWKGYAAHLAFSKSEELRQHKPRFTQEQAMRIAASAELFVTPDSPFNPKSVEYALRINKGGEQPAEVLAGQDKAVIDQVRQISDFLAYGALVEAYKSLHDGAD